MKVTSMPSIVAGPRSLRSTALSGAASDEAALMSALSPVYTSSNASVALLMRAAPSTRMVAAPRPR